MVIIRFVRVGRRNQAYFHLVAAEKSKAVQKKYIEKLGYYNPHTDKGEGEIVVDEARVKYFISKGAQMSESAARLLTKKGIKEAGKFITERLTKPKKTAPPKTEPPATETPTKPTEEKIEEPSAEEAKEETSAKETPVEKTEEKVDETLAEEEKEPTEEKKEAVEEKKEEEIVEEKEGEKSE